MTSIPTSLKYFFKNYHTIEKYIVAFSGGLDSSVLLHSMQAIGIDVEAVHVNHHLQNESDKWEEHCEKFCKQLNILLHVEHAKIDNASEKSIEENARDVRYELLAKSITSGSALVTAHHKNDLAETILLQLLRGAGPAGLATMPSEKKFNKGLHLRPLLEFTRNELVRYAQQHKIIWVEDVSNACISFDRNYLRHEIMPKLLQRWPGALETLSRAASLQADALNCLTELAKQDLALLEDENSNILDIAKLQILDSARLKNLLRTWIVQHDIRVPSKKALDQIIRDMVLPKVMQTSPMQSWSDGEIRRYRNHLYLMRPLGKHDPTQEFRWKINQPLYIESIDCTLRETDLMRNKVMLPKGTQEVIVRFRTGGETLKPIGNKHHRSLKNLYQEAHIPPWERDRIPLLYVDSQLYSVLGYWNSAP